MKNPQGPAQACVIWMHGLGADASDMEGLAEQLTVKDVALRHVFIDAPMRPVTLNGGMVMRAWYDILGMRLTDREDRDGIFQSTQLIHAVIEEQIKAGFHPTQIFLAGFSQGGAMALFAGLRFPKPLAGVVALSAYLPLFLEPGWTLEGNTPIFMAVGRHDPLVLPDWTKQSVEHLKALGYSNITCHDYPMEHSVCMDELKDLARWLSTQIEALTCCKGALS